MSKARSALDHLLAPFEARPVSRSPDDIARSRREHALGEHLARLQGADDNEAYRRLRELVMLGKATSEEVLELGAEVARRGLFCAGSACDFGTPRASLNEIKTRRQKWAQ